MNKQFFNCQTPSKQVVIDYKEALAIFLSGCNPVPKIRDSKSIHF